MLAKTENPARGRGASSTCLGWTGQREDGYRGRRIQGFGDAARRKESAVLQTSHAPLERARALLQISADQYEAGVKFRHHFACRGAGFHRERLREAHRTLRPVCGDLVRLAICHLRPLHDCELPLFRRALDLLCRLWAIALNEFKPARSFGNVWTKMVGAAIQGAAV